MWQLLAKIKYLIFHKLTLWHYCKLCKHPAAYLICNKCLNKLKQIEEPWCKRCLATKVTNTSECYYCKSNDIFFDQIYCLFEYTAPLSTILHDFKYKKQIQYGWMLSYLLHLTIMEIKTPYDIIIPMPIHKSRKKERGFNQAKQLLNFYIAVANNPVKIVTSAVKRIKNTQHQTLITPSKRHENLHNAFQLQRSVTNLHILIIDDVVTSGNTANELSCLLKQNGATRVDICCLMRTAPFYSKYS